jgi:hypothetical protein
MPEPDCQKVAEAIAAGRHAEATEVLDLLLAFFADGVRWIRGRLHDRHGNRCLIGGLQQAPPRFADYVQRPQRQFLRTCARCSSKRASWRRCPTPANSNRSGSRRSRQWHAPAIRDGNPLTEPECASLAKLEAAAAAKRRLLAEIELERWRGQQSATPANFRH